MHKSRTQRSLLDLYRVMRCTPARQEAQSLAHMWTMTRASMLSLQGHMGLRTARPSLSSLARTGVGHVFPESLD